MFRFLSALGVVAALAIASHASVVDFKLKSGASRLLNLDDIQGNFRRVTSLSTPQCPNVIRHTAASNPIDHADISMNNKKCDDGFTTELFDTAVDAQNAAQTQFAKDLIGEIADIKDMLITEVYGIERNGRTCGNRPLDILGNDTLVIFLRTSEYVRTDSYRYRSDFRYMILLTETDGSVDRECIYEAPLRPSAAPTSSPSPSAGAASPSPSVSALPSATVETPAATPEDGDGDGDGDHSTPEPEDPNEEESSPEGGSGGSGSEDDDGDEMTESAEPSQSAEESGEGVCFPADGTVELENGETKRMDQVQVGDRVKVGAGVFSDVFMFTHKTPMVVNQFVTVESESGHIMSATPKHYIYINNQLVAASTAKVGDFVTIGNGESSRIVRVSREWKSGLYNPQTMQGNIVVNGVQASTFTQTVELCTAQALMAPLRMVYKALGFSLSALNNGAGSIASYIPKGNVAA